MPIEFRCEHCDKLMRTPDDSGGKKGRCPHCKETTQIPVQSTAGLNQPVVEKPVPPVGGPGMGSGVGGPGVGGPGAYQASAAPSGFAGTGSYSNLTPHKGQLVLILGIISTVLSVIGVCCCPFGLGALGCGIPAIILGSTDMKGMSQGIIDPSGKGQSQTGMILGIVGVAISALRLVAGIGLSALSMLSQ